ncbi:MAG: hypothetical protein HQL54_14100, partial [Magnetococcales bacterium]|nr:hypothetical protein [Magnetococcales bacterium]
SLRLRTSFPDPEPVVMPVDGMLLDFPFSERGETIPANAHMVMIAPLGISTTAVAVIPSSDIGFVHKGGRGLVKLDAYPYHRFGAVYAQVTRIQPIPNTTDFKVTLTLNKTTIKVNERQVPILPGLAAQVDILTEKRRILDMLLERLE